MSIFNDKDMRTLNYRFPIFCNVLVSLEESKGSSGEVANCLKNWGNLCLGINYKLIPYKEILENLNVTRKYGVFVASSINERYRQVSTSAKQIDIDAILNPLDEKTEEIKNQTPSLPRAKLPEKISVCISPEKATQIQEEIERLEHELFCTKAIILETKKALDELQKAISLDRFLAGEENESIFANQKPR